MKKRGNVVMAEREAHAAAGVVAGLGEVLENPTKLPETFNTEGDKLPAAPVALEVFSQEECDFIWRCMTEYEIESSPENEALWLAVCAKFGKLFEVPSDGAE